ncbi:MAG TPA: HNH endonuclease [Acidimicrobiia bacterium]
MDSLGEYRHYDHIVRNMVEEHVGRTHVLMAVQQLIAALDANRWIWQWGDGYGGWVKDVIVSQVESIGLPWEEPRTPSANSIRREHILMRDGYACVNCSWDEQLQIDHIHPRSKGGGDEEENLQVLCGPCNRSKRAKSMEEWEQSGDAAKMRERDPNEH